MSDEKIAALWGMLDKMEREVRWFVVERHSAPDLHDLCDDARKLLKAIDTPRSGKRDTA